MTDTLESEEVDMNRKVYEIVLNSIYREAQIAIRQIKGRKLMETQALCQHTSLVMADQDSEYDEQEGISPRPSY